MKHPDRICIQDFIRFIGAVHNQQKLIRDSLDRKDVPAAQADAEYLEVVLCDWARDVSMLSRAHWQTVENCAAEIVANDLDVEIYEKLTVNASRSMRDKITKTIGRFFT